MPTAMDLKVQFNSLLLLTEKSSFTIYDLKIVSFILLHKFFYHYCVFILGNTFIS